MGGLQAVPPLLNGGARSTWLSANPNATRHLQVSSAGAVSTSAFDGSFGTLTGTPTTLSGYGITNALDLTGGTLTGLLQFSGTDHAGFRLNNLTTAQRNDLSGTAGMAIWNTTDSRLNVHNGTSWTAGFVRLDGDTMTGGLLATSFEARNATTATSVLVHNTWTSSTNRETGYMRWASNILSIGTEKGSGGGSARALQIETDGIVRLGIQTDYQIRVGDQGTNAPTLFSFSGSNLSSPGAGRGLSFFSRVSANGSFCFAFTGTDNAQTTGTNALLRVAANFNPVGGDATFVHVSVGGTINQTSGATGITRGFLASHTLTSAADYRAFDCTNATGFAYHSSGAAPSRLGGALTWVPLSSVTLATNGQWSVEMTSNTAGNLVYRGSDGVTRRCALTFS